MDSTNKRIYRQINSTWSWRRKIKGKNTRSNERIKWTSILRTTEEEGSYEKENIYLEEEESTDSEDDESEHSYSIQEDLDYLDYICNEDEEEPEIDQLMELFDKENGTFTE